jgi:hypothetical protein
MEPTCRLNPVPFNTCGDDWCSHWSATERASKEDGAGDTERRIQRAKLAAELDKLDEISMWEAERQMREVVERLRQEATPPPSPLDDIPDGCSYSILPGRNDYSVQAAGVCGGLGASGKANKIGQEMWL